VQATPTPAGGAALYGVSCPAVADCWAVGAIPPGTTSSEPLAEHWNGKTWAVEPVSARSQAHGLLDAVTCVSATSCLAVGAVIPAGASGYRPLAEAWNGTAWSVQKVPEPAGDNTGTLNALSCSAAAACTAVGNAASPATTGTLAERWNGRTWTVQSTHVTGRVPSLIGVSCLSATNWNGSTWTALPAPKPIGTFSGLSAVSCSSASACLAVGEENTSASTGTALAEHWNGSTWTVQPTHVTGAAPYLLGVSCPSASNCTAVGYQLSSSPEPTLVEHWNGTAWSRQSAPSPGSSENALSGVSCTTTRCLAVGDEAGSTTRNPLAEAN